MVMSWYYGAMTDKTHGPLERKTCPRCCGSGNYGPTQVYGGRCFDCHGKGTLLTKRGHAAASFFDGLRDARADEIKVGDLIRVGGMTGGCEPFDYYARVVEIIPESRTCVIKPDGTSVPMYEITTEHPRFGRSGLSTSRDATVKRGFTRDEKAVALAKALAFQATLGPSGKPMRLKKDGTPYAARKPRAPKVPVESTATKTTKPGRVITAQYPGVCRDCGATFEAGTKVLWSRDHGTTCVECSADAASPVHGADPEVKAVPEVDPEAVEAAREREADEREYQAGIAEAEQYRAEREMFGQDVADALDIERDLRAGA